MNRQKNIFHEVAGEFIEDFKSNHWPCSVILDGSVNNNEHVYGFSDIDLKIFAESEIINKDFLVSVSNSIRKSLGKEKIIFNVWVLSRGDFPDKEDGVYFDFVRRYVLKSGQLLLGDLKLNTIKIKKEINADDRDLCVKTIVGFLIRLRRLLTNPTAISDVQKSDVSLFLQQGIAYYFHFLRYYNAFFGDVTLKIKDNLTLYCHDKLVSKDQRNFAQEIFIMRNNWKKILSAYNKSSAFDFLTKVVRHIEFTLDHFMRPNLNLKNQVIIYK